MFVSVVNTKRIVGRLTHPFDLFVVYPISPAAEALIPMLQTHRYIYKAVIIPRRKRKPDGYSDSAYILSLGGPNIRQTHA